MVSQLNLFTKRATTNIIDAPNPTGHSTYQYPSLWIALPPITAISAVAPPGGCPVPVSCIAKMDKATASGHARILWSPRSKKTVTPMRADRQCPPIRLRG